MTQAVKKTHEKTIEEIMKECTFMLENMKNYDSKQFAIQLHQMLKELEFFYNKLVPEQGGNSSKTYYNVKPHDKRPKAGQVAYFNLRRGYPKELFDGHWCYVFKDFGAKLLIVPLTSVKENDLINDYEIEIEIVNFPNEHSSRLQVTDLRFVDIQRINEKKDTYDVSTATDEINQKILEKLDLTKASTVL